MGESMQPHSRAELPRREVMQTPDAVAAILRLKALGWGIPRIAKELGCSHIGFIGKGQLRAPDSLHRRLVKRAKRGGVGLNSPSTLAGGLGERSAHGG